MDRALKHCEPDRVPVSDFFWGQFLQRWREELGLPADTDIYRYYDLDWTQTNPNMDPHIQPFEILRSNENEVVVRTGFGATIRKRLDLPMPEFVAFETSTIEQMEAFQFDDPWDDRRYFSRGDDQISGVGDGFTRDLPSFVDRVAERWREFPVYGGVCEGHEMLWRIIGSENALMWMAEYPDRLARFVERICAFSLEIVRAQIKAAGGKLDGMVIWGDVAYKKGMLFSPAYWHQVFRPGVQAIVDECHAHGVPVIYHGCGCSKKIFQDFVDIGIDAYNPLEAKAGMDAVELRRIYGHRIAFCGNMDVQVWAEGSRDEIRTAAVTRLNAAKGGGYIFQSDHSVPSNVSGENYDYVVKLVRQYGTYPLQLGEFDMDMTACAASGG
jgi:hypothetical protein